MGVIEDDVSFTNVLKLALILEEKIVLDDIPDLPTAVALLIGLIYALNIEYEKELKYTFETIQKVFLKLNTNLSARVQAFKNKLLRC